MKQFFVGVMIFGVGVFACAQVSSVPGGSVPAANVVQTEVKPGGKPAKVNIKIKNTAALSWIDLSSDQQALLKPLKNEWEMYTPVQKKRWLNLANRYAQMTPVQQQKFNELLNLPPDQRKVVRETYKKNSNLASDHRREQWERYQRLSADEKQKILEEARQKKKVKLSGPQENTSKPSGASPLEPSPSVKK